MGRGDAPACRAPPRPLVALGAVRLRTILAIGLLAVLICDTRAAADWPTYHAGQGRLGAVSRAPSLSHFGRRWSAPVDGSIYAEPLVAGGRVIAATENDSLYAFDARTGRRLWRAALGTPVPGGALPCGDIDPSGITGTPVVDSRSNTVYAVVFDRPARHMLVAVNLTDGSVRWQRPIDPPGADPRVQQERGALSLSRGRVYVPYGGLDGDCGDYHGWVVGAPAGGPSAKLVSYRVPAHREAGIWAPSGAAVDRRGNLFVATGNGDSSGFDFGNSVIRLSPALRRTGFFSPRDNGSNNASDTDLGSTGPLLLPGGRVFEIGKDGVGYLLRARRLGGIGHQLSATKLCSGGAYSSSAYARGFVYVACTDGVVAARVTRRGLRPAWRGPGFRAGGPIVAGAQVWALDLDGGSLYGLDRHTGRVRAHVSVGGVAQFATPAAGDGEIFAGAGSRLEAFGG